MRDILLVQKEALARETFPAIDCKTFHDESSEATVHVCDIMNTLVPVVYVGM